ACLNKQFPRRWMGWYGPIRWRARSPDLNPLDFFFWSYCKELIYKTLPEDAEDLETRLRYAIWAIEQDIMENVQRNLLRCMQGCILMVILNIFYKIFSSVLSGHLKQCTLFRAFKTIRSFQDDRKQSALFRMTNTFLPGIFLVRQSEKRKE
ncbi:hypothetical protein ALC56_00283, partial [Trachymyrmex septentrionalis]